MDAGSSSSLELPQQFRQFTISEIHFATQNFDDSLIIGRGGFGSVYKGTVTNRASSLVVAVKRLDSSSNQGAEEFWNEVQMLSQLRHCHLVSLIGYCNDGQEMILLYEYMPSGTLEDHLHKFLSILPWVRRLKICIGAARGLDYLHTGTGTTRGIIHRDVKSSNILLDDSLAAKISDFGLSKRGPINQPSTYVNTFVKGTFGYLDPDYYATGRLTRKSDVYAFGVVLFEALSGKRAVDQSLDEEHWGLVNWVQESVKEGRLKQIVDCYIRETISPKCLKEFGRLAVRCVHSNPKKRPTMAEVVACLESLLVLQEKANHTSHPSAGMKIFGNQVPMFLSAFTVGSKISLKLYFYTVGGQNRILRKFMFETINVATENFSEDNLVKLLNLGFLYKVYIVMAWFRRGESAPPSWELVIEFKNHVSDWNKRNQIILAVARALLYLHQHDVIHANVTAGNIILDHNLHPKLSDYGFARCLAIKEDDCIEVGTVRRNIDYMAPEVKARSCLSTKVDVYCFGVLILETITGSTKWKCHGIYLTTRMEFVKHVWTNWAEGKYLNLIDPIISDAHPSSITKVIHIGLLCVQDDAANRPTMEEVVRMLTNSSPLTLPIPKKPIYSTD